MVEEIDTGHAYIHRDVNATVMHIHISVTHSYNLFFLWELLFSKQLLYIPAEIQTLRWVADFVQTI